jgi:hypothetical protein
MKSPKKRWLRKGLKITKVMLLAGLSPLGFTTFSCRKWGDRITKIQAEVTIQRDRWGISYIWADNSHDLLMAQGYTSSEITEKMPSMFKRTAILSATAAIALLFAGCGESKVAQCNKVIKVANQATVLGQGFDKNSQSAKGTKGLTELATKIDQIATEMKAVEIKDEKLQGFQGQFLKLYQDISKNLNQTATAIDKKNLPAANKFLASLKKSSSEETTIVKEINGYCAGK